MGERETDLSARVLMTMPGGMATMLALSSGMPSAPAGNTSWSWIEDAHISGNQEVVTGGNSAATAIEFDDAGIWIPGQVLMNENTAEYVLVTSIDADGVTVNITRGFAGTTAQAITAADTFQSLGTAFAEGSDRPSPVTQKGEERTNYVQIFKNAWAITGTARAVKYITGNQTAYNREMCFAYHAEDIERAFLWGRKSVSVVGGNQMRTSNGLVPQVEQYGGLVVSANTDSVAGQLSLKDLQNFMRRIFDVQAKGLPNERIAFCGSSLLELIQQMVMLDTQYETSVNETEFGFKVMKINVFNGNLSFVTHPLMVENAYWQKQLYVFHPGLIRKRVLRGTWTEEFGQDKQNNNGRDAVEGYIADELGFELKGARTMGIYKNIETAVASF
jgi:hypothetical protein